MFGFIKKVFITLLSFTELLAGISIKVWIQSEWKEFHEHGKMISFITLFFTTPIFYYT